MNRFARLVLLLPFALAACDDASHLHPTAAAGAEIRLDAVGETAALMKAVRGATARYNSTTQAIAAGYVPTDHCVPEMGYHWVNESLVDPVFDPMQPEVVIYAHDEGGRLRLVAVEYIVIDVGQPQPDFAGRAFDVGGTPVPVPHWSQHVWLYEANPDGGLTAFNPAIACP
jgi:hypothetical protein